MSTATKRLALCLAAGMIGGCAGCSGPTAAAPSPRPPANVTAAPSPGSAGASSLSITPSGQPAAAVATSYYRAIVTRNYRRAFSYLAANATGPGGQRLTLPQFLQLAHMLDNEWGPVTSFSVGGFPAMVVMTAERQKISLYHAHLRLARHKGSWAITSIDRI